MVGAVLALNGVYLPHNQLKWQRALIADLGLAPPLLAERLELMANASAAEALRAVDSP